MTTVERIDKTQTDAVAHVRAYADRLEKHVDDVEKREQALLVRVDSLELEAAECHKNNLTLNSELLSFQAAERNCRERVNGLEARLSAMERRHVE